MMNLAEATAWQLVTDRQAVLRSSASVRRSRVRRLVGRAMIRTGERVAGQPAVAAVPQCATMGA